MGRYLLLLRRSDALTLELRRRLHGGTHDHLTARGTGNGAADQQQVALGIDAHDLQILDGATDLAHVAGHALAGKHATRGLALTDGARRAMRHGHAVRSRQTAEVVALHDAGVTLTDGGAGHVDDLADFE